MNANIHFITGQNNLYEDYYTSHNIQKSSLDSLFLWLKTKEINNSMYFAVDTETTAHDPFYSAILLLQIGDKDRQYVIDCTTVDIKSFIKPYLESKDWIKYLHNAKFDYKHITHHWNIKLERVYDTFLAEMCLFNGLQFKGYGLKDLVEKYSNNKITLQKDVRETFGPSTINFTIPQIHYAAADVRYFELIVEEQQKLAKQYELVECIRLENEAVLAYGDIELNGLLIDTEAWKAIALEQEQKLRDQEKKLDQYLISLSKEDPRFKKFVSDGIPQSLFADIDLPIEKKGKRANTHNRKQVLVEWSSQQQVLPIFQLHGIDTTYTDVKTNETRESISAMILEKNRNIPFVQIYEEYKKAQKQVDSFGLKFLSHINEKTGRIHPTFKQLGTETGRVSCNEPKLNWAFYW